jgi:hypothetical protein
VLSETVRNALISATGSVLAVILVLILESTRRPSIELTIEPWPPTAYGRKYLRVLARNRAASSMEPSLVCGNGEHAPAQVEVLQPLVRLVYHAPARDLAHFGD